MRSPFDVLGLEPDVDDDEVIRRAYLDAVRRCPPERDPKGFAAVREAYDRIRDRRSRLAYRLFAVDPVEPADIAAAILDRHGRRKGMPDAGTMRRLLETGLSQVLRRELSG